MGEQEPKRMKKHICVGLLAHVDAGKTTLSEALLYNTGGIRRAGRVDNKDSFLDTFYIEKERGITIFSKMARLSDDQIDITLLDTPGHVDFSAEMERTLQVLDYAILVISGTDGVQGHTRTLWKLLARYQVPVFIFINKTDLPGSDVNRVMGELRKQLDGGCVNFVDDRSVRDEEIAACDEKVMDSFFDCGRVDDEDIAYLISERRIFPCYCGSALKLEGVGQLWSGLNTYTLEPEYPEAFGVRVYKISRDLQGNRLTWLKVTGGTLKARDYVCGEKANQLRLYSGDRFMLTDEAAAGEICAVTGPENTMPGQGDGYDCDTTVPVLEPVLTYTLILPEGSSAVAVMPELIRLEEEVPELHLIYSEEAAAVQVQLMGEVQLEILHRLILDRIGIDVSFGAGSIVYRETITYTVEGVGHFEPLRHYAEVHLLMEPGPVGSGLEILADCSEDILDRNWQRLVLAHLEEREHPGVLTGAPITDMRITLKTGRAHIKHTEGGDFRQATYRAVRNGLMKAHCQLLEPFYHFTLNIPEDCVGRAMNDINRMYGHFESPVIEHGMATIEGRCPVASMQGYHTEVTAYSRGTGSLVCVYDGYDLCHNADEVIEAAGYVAEADTANPADSVFCSHGAGMIVPWNEVSRYMHLESVLEDNSVDEPEDNYVYRPSTFDDSIGTEEIDQIIMRSGGANMGKDTIMRKKWKRTHAHISEPIVKSFNSARVDNSVRYLLVDGYNIIFAWKELSELARDNIDGARGRLLDIMCNYQAIINEEVIVVFDAYRLVGHQTEYMDYHNIHVVYTREAETADRYIERFAHENGRKYQVTVATSDGVEQVIIMGQGCRLISARELERDVSERSSRLIQEYTQNNEK